MNKETIVLVSLAAVAIGTAIWALLLLRFKSRGNSAQRDGMFRFNDGINIRIVDPIDVLQCLDAHPEFRIDVHPRQAEAGNTNALKICVDAIQKAFQVEKFTCKEKPGLTVVEMLRLLQAFEIFALRVKKNTGLSPT